MIDFKKTIEEEEKNRKKQINNAWEKELIVNNKKRKKLVTYTIAIIVIALIFSGKILISSQSGADWISEGGIFNKLRKLVTSNDKLVNGEEDDRINILLLGMGGEGHDGAYLTDTVMLASLKPSSKEVALISFPRDMVSPTNNWRKINSINAYAEQKEEGSGGEETMKSMEELLQLPIHYYVRVDFKGFVNIIDELGGIEINVENTFDDYTYPIYGQEDNPDYYSRFEHLHIDEGPQTMSGTLALKYSRSRHAFGIEGSDFARAKRQQLVLEAAKNKLLSSKTLLNPVIITKLINEFSQNIATNLDVWEMIRLWNLFKDVDRSKIINKVLNDAPDNFLIASKGEDGAYILIPRSGNFAEIKGMIRNIFNNSDVQEMPKETEKITDDSKIIILNGTWITGLAGKTANKLSLSGFDIIETGNADERTFSETVFYDLSYGKKKTSLETLKRITNAKQIFDTPAWVKEYSAGGSEQPDFLLILGEDAN